MSSQPNQGPGLPPGSDPYNPFPINTAMPVTGPSMTDQSPFGLNAGLYYPYAPDVMHQNWPQQGGYSSPTPMPQPWQPWPPPPQSGGQPGGPPPGGGGSSNPQVAYRQQLEEYFKANPQMASQMAQGLYQDIPGASPAVNDIMRGWAGNTSANGFFGPHKRLARQLAHAQGNAARGGSYREDMQGVQQQRLAAAGQLPPELQYGAAQMGGTPGQPGGNIGGGSPGSPYGGPSYAGGQNGLPMGFPNIPTQVPPNPPFSQPGYNTPGRTFTEPGQPWTPDAGSGARMPSSPVTPSLSAQYWASMGLPVYGRVPLGANISPHIVDSVYEYGKQLSNPDLGGKVSSQSKINKYTRSQPGVSEGGSYF